MKKPITIEKETMNNLIKKLLIGAMVGLMTACSSDSEEVIVPGGEDITPTAWRQIRFSTTVEGGSKSDATTRYQGELDNQGRPRNQYPKGLGVYMHKYEGSDGGSLNSTVLTICEPDSESDNTSGLFRYTVNENDNTIALRSDIDGETEQLTFDIGNPGSTAPGNLFFFTSQPEAENVELPAIENPYPSLYEGNTYGELGDKLFATEGYFFAWTNEEKSGLGLYSITHNTTNVTLVAEVPFMEEDNAPVLLRMQMKRMTSCLSVRLIIGDHFDENNVLQPVEGYPAYAPETLQEAIDLTNKALDAYLNRLHRIDDVGNVRIQDLFVRRKVLDNFPHRYNWMNGYVTTGEGERGSLFICNLDYPAWVNDIALFENGDNWWRGVTARCDSEPFIPANGTISGVELHLFVGMGTRDESNKKQGGTYNKAVRLKLALGTQDTPTPNAYSVSANTITSLYIGLTLANVVTLYDATSNQRSSTRSGDVIEEITIPAEQVFMTSEPL